MTCLSQSPAWRALEAHQVLLAKQSLNDLFQQDIRRFESFSLQFENMLVDFSKQLITQDTIELLLTLARQRGLESWIKKMLRGEKINDTEQRAALHMALRSDTPVMLEGEDVTQKAGAVLDKMARFTNAVHSGEYKGYSGKPITDIVNIGIGGSDLGPYMVTDALKPYACKQLKIHFVSDIDGSQIYEALNQLDAATTLFIVASKTFTSRETLTNAHTARRWFVAQSGDETQVARHFIAVTANRDKAAKFGVKAENLFEFWDWVGGRYSVWSAIGLPVALSVGMDHFRALLAGANTMDRHFTSAPLAQNIPVLLGLIAVWQINFLNVSSHVVLPYDQYLHRFPAYLQQLEMESNGKRITREGETVDYRTGVAVWGEAGTNGQHAFFQLLHQGTESYSADFLVPCQSQHPMGEHHHWLLANFIAQTQALMRGQSAQEAQQELARQNISPERQAQLLPHKIHPGNHFTTAILFEKLDPKTLGMLLAMYEHKVFVQSVIWNINPFDQWGVELGKQLAKKILPELTQTKTESTTALDASSNGLINFIKRHSGKAAR